MQNRNLLHDIVAMANARLQSTSFTKTQILFLTAEEEVFLHSCYEDKKRAKTKPGSCNEDEKRAAKTESP